VQHICTLSHTRTRTLTNIHTPYPSTLIQTAQPDRVCNAFAHTLSLSHTHITHTHTHTDTLTYTHPLSPILFKTAPPDRACNTFALSFSFSLSLSHTHTHIPSIHSLPNRTTRQGVQHICAAVERGDLHPEDVTEDLISNSLYTAPYSQVDLLVRTSGTTHVCGK